MTLIFVRLAGWWIKWKVFLWWSIIPNYLCWPAEIIASKFELVLRNNPPKSTLMLDVELAFVHHKGWLGYRLYFSFGNDSWWKTIICKVNVDRVGFFWLFCSESRRFARWLMPIFWWWSGCGNCFSLMVLVVRLVQLTYLCRLRQA